MRCAYGSRVLLRRLVYASRFWVRMKLGNSPLLAFPGGQACAFHLFAPLAHAALRRYS